MGYPTTRLDALNRYRLSERDEATIEHKINLVLAAWRHHHRDRDPLAATDHDCLVRIGARAIGCRTTSLRASELAWLESTVSELCRRWGFR